MSANFAQFVNVINANHVMLVLGSAISYWEPSRCASVKEIRDEYILRPTARRIAEMGHRNKAAISFAAKLIDTMLVPGQSASSSEETENTLQLRQEIEGLPFEQFMHCVHRASPKFSQSVIERACQLHEKRIGNIGPNANHLWFVDFALSLLSRASCNEITILTTNYDTFLEEAFRTLKPDVDLTEETIEPSAIPAYSARIDSKSFRIIKLHGCLTRPDTLVYQIDRWIPFLFEDDWHKAIPDPDAILCAGYSFSDPHLRPLFRRWKSMCTKDETTKMLVLDRAPADTSKLSESISKDSLSGPEHLRYDFYRDVIDDCVMFCDLQEIGSYKTTETDWAISHSPKANSLPSSNLETSQRYRDNTKMVSELESSQIIDLLSALVESCARGDAYEMLSAYIFETADFRSNSNMSEGNINRTTRLLRQMGHNNNYAGAISLCQSLREKVPDSKSMALVTLGYESFATSINAASKNAKDQTGEYLAAYDLIKAGERLMPRLDRMHEWTDAEAFFYHRKLHFYTKLVTLRQMNPGIERHPKIIDNPKLYELMRPDLYEQTKELSALTARATAREKDRCRLYEMTELKDLHAQLLALLAVMDSNVHLANEAVTTAEKVRDVYYSIGQLNSVLLADRTLGWAYLSAYAAHKGSERIVFLEKALNSFALGFQRSLKTSDKTLKQKLGANLLRIIDPPHVTAKNREIPLPDAPPSLNMLNRDLLARSGAKDTDGIEYPKLSRIIYLNLFDDDEDAKKLKSHIAQYADLEKYPIYLTS